MPSPRKGRGKKRSSPVKKSTKKAASPSKRARVDSGDFAACFNDSSDDEDSKETVRAAVICACNMNRSMAAHKILEEHDFIVTSYGAATGIKLPSVTGKPYEFPFGTPYKDMLKELKASPEAEFKWLESKSIIKMLTRNVELKDHPERWQDLKEITENIVICFDDRIYDLVIEDIEGREASEFRDVHVVSFDVKDDHQSAQIGADLALRFCELCKDSGNLETEVPTILADLEDEGQKFTIQYTCLHV